MESRINEFLKCCNLDQNSQAFVKLRQDQSTEIKNSEEFKKKLRIHSALANKNRFLIYRLIQKEELCNCALARILGLTEGSITHHIKKLEKAGLIIGKNQGHFTIYYTKENLKKIL